ncbi:hypothetical protein P4O66_008456 [Electrophorus voltai]|uniref:Reverse transcriptase/retrotransposon-derived protein RNase H-like domain-containing protein n=1 Tax=Electrophorus voltai TaxID=2609070 RepID=A0AAD8ZGD8_9TELE|nr:hypothetical protein P4O66_008456 [Electrophorus voltai]
MQHPDPEEPFVVEVDTETGVGAVLSQHIGKPPILHPVTYYSCKLLPAERNYDVGSRELLAVKSAVEEWRHWLDGLFFNRCNFQITSRPGSWNAKPDVLFGMYEVSISELVIDRFRILPTEFIIGAVQWDFEELRGPHGCYLLVRFSITSCSPVDVAE